MFSPSHVKLLRVQLKKKPVRVDHFIFKLHYRFTYLLFMVFAIISATHTLLGKPIQCMVTNDPDAVYKKNVINNYCLISGTFTVDRHQNASGKEAELPLPGAGPVENNEPITVHAYYLWVPLMLFIQGVIFYIPHWLWKGWEGDILKNLMSAVPDCLHDPEDLNRRLEIMSKYFKDQLHQRDAWAIKFFFCEFLNLICAISSILMLNAFLGGEFFSYGSEIFSLLDEDPENRTDPMSFVFPLMAKCTFKKYGSSGTVETFDYFCLLPSNIANEKIFAILWLWLTVLAKLSFLWMGYRLATVACPAFRNFVLEKVLASGVRKSTLKAVIDNTSSIGDWFLLCHFRLNMDRLIFSSFLLTLASNVKQSESTTALAVLPNSSDKVGRNENA